jgi:hypothetical protein
MARAVRVVVALYSGERGEDEETGQLLHAPHLPPQSPGGSQE